MLNLKHNVTVEDWGWENAVKMVEKEKRCVKKLEAMIEAAVPPISFHATTDNGFRVFIYPPTEADEDAKHRLLAWLVQQTGKKFTRFFREEQGTVTFWNGDDHKFTDADGEFEMLILFERAAIGKCRVVEVEKTVKVKEIVCEEATA